MALLVVTVKDQLRLLDDTLDDDDVAALCEWVRLRHEARKDPNPT